MLQLLQVLCIVLAAVGVSLTLAHALELPGKRRLDRETYAAVQPIYYPGFTIGALFGEVGAMAATFVLILVTPAGTPGFWLTLAAFVSLLAMHAIYWVVTHPVNKVWLKDQPLKGAGATFFEAGGAERVSEASDWTALRDRWEYSHVARATFAMLALIALAIAVTL